MLKLFFATLLAATLSACGGGGTHVTPMVFKHEVSSLQYGKTASIALQGRYLSNDMTVEAGSCSKPSFNASSTPERAVLNCKVTATGAMTLVIKDSTGQAVYSATFTVPKPQVTLLTSKGNVVLELEPDVAAVTVNNFLGYVNSGYYQGTLVHRVISGFVVQGGGYTTGMIKKPGQLAPIGLESNKGLLNTVGTVAMARTSLPDSATSEFFINLVDNPALDYKNEDEPGYAVFGTVLQGMDIVKTIAIVQTAAIAGFANVPTEDVTITFALQTR